MFSSVFTTDLVLVFVLDSNKKIVNLKLEIIVLQKAVQSVGKALVIGLLSGH